MDRMERARKNALTVAEWEDYAAGVPADVEQTLPDEFLANVSVPEQWKKTLEGFLRDYDTVEELLDVSWDIARGCRALQYIHERAARLPTGQRLAYDRAEITVGVFIRHTLHGERRESLAQDARPSGKGRLLLRQPKASVC